MPELYQYNCPINIVPELFLPSRLLYAYVLYIIIPTLNVLCCLFFALSVHGEVINYIIPVRNK